MSRWTDHRGDLPVLTSGSASHSDSQLPVFSKCFPTFTLPVVFQYKSGSDFSLECTGSRRRATRCGREERRRQTVRSRRADGGGVSGRRLVNFIFSNPTTKVILSLIFYPVTRYTKSGRMPPQYGWLFSWRLSCKFLGSPPLGFEPFFWDFTPLLT